MTSKEALNWLDVLNPNASFHNTEKWEPVKEAYQCARDALGKQVPKKPQEKNITEYCVDWVCATCERFHRTEWKMNYCSECGQAIDWSEDVEADL